mgnify:CR=1 FL=1
MDRPTAARRGAHLMLDGGQLADIVILTKDVFAGMMSVRTTPVALTSPWLVTVSV